MRKQLKKKGTKVTMDIVITEKIQNAHGLVVK